MAAWGAYAFWPEQMMNPVAAALIPTVSQDTENTQKPQPSKPAATDNPAAIADKSNAETTQPPENGDSEDNSRQITDANELSSILLLVNRNNALSADYVPQDLVSVDVRFSPNAVSSRKKMRKEAADALTELFKGADQEGITLYGVSGYRSYQTQKAIYESKVRAAGQAEADRFVAKPGKSEHQSGLAMDVTNSDGLNKTLSQEFGDTPEGIWLKENAYRFGFIIRYQQNKENSTGYSYEPWHIRYVGKEAAEKIYNRGLP